MGGNRLIYFKELAHMIVEAENFKIFRVESQGSPLGPLLMQRGEPRVQGKLR